jgi:hypothetical protein
MEPIECPALHKRRHDKGYPFGDRVPLTVRLRRTVHTDIIPGIGFISTPPVVAKEAETFPAWTNSYGAVCAVFPDGKQLGLKPDEFEVVEWHTPEARP